MQENRKSDELFIIRVLQGMLIGLGAVLPGMSGGVLCVVFGIYKPIMELFANPKKCFRTHIPKLFPVVVGCVAGFVGVANLLSFFLEKYPNQSVCLFIGLIVGMFPSLLREAGEQGRTRGSWMAMGISFAAIIVLLSGLNVMSVKIVPNTGWYVFCGFCLALSIIAPGMSFSTLLMPLGLYTPFVDGLGHLDMGILIPSGIGTIATILCLAKAVETLFRKFYSCAFHAIVGIVAAATIMIIPFQSFMESWGIFLANSICLVVGIVCAWELDKFNNRYPKEKSQ